MKTVMIDLQNVKIRAKSDEESLAIQKRLRELGYSNDECAIDWPREFIVTHQFKKWYWSHDDVVSFFVSDKREISLSDLFDQPE